jgi:hypothetical protein
MTEWAKCERACAFYKPATAGCSVVRRRVREKSASGRTIRGLRNDQIGARGGAAQWMSS